MSKSNRMERVGWFRTSRVEGGIHPVRITKHTDGTKVGVGLSADGADNADEDVRAVFVTRGESFRVLRAFRGPGTVEGFGPRNTLQSTSR